MKRSRLFGLLLLPAALLFATSSLQAQDDMHETIAPDGQFGLQAGTHGVGLQYAASPSIQIGSTVGILFGDAPTDIILGPYVKWLFEGDVNPYAKVGADIVMPDNDNLDSYVDIGVSGGLEYYITPNFGVFGEVRVFGFLSENNPSVTDGDADVIFGLPTSGHAGVEWFFD
jgi:hypothetical protein